jgi:predicted HTH domain antitoxin
MYNYPDEVYMKTISIELPDFVNIEPREIKLVLASKLYEKGTLSLGQAAELAGLSKKAFMEILADYGVTVFNYNPEEIENDYKNA